MASSGVHVTSSANGSSTAASSTVVVVVTAVAVAVTITPAREPLPHLFNERMHNRSGLAFPVRVPLGQGTKVLLRRTPPVAGDTEAIETGENELSNELAWLARESSFLIEIFLRTAEEGGIAGVDISRPATANQDVHRVTHADETGLHSHLRKGLHSHLRKHAVTVIHRKVTTPAEKTGLHNHLR
jgi:hypothetical protein